VLLAPAAAVYGLGFPLSHALWPPLLNSASRVASAPKLKLSPLIKVAVSLSRVGPTRATVRLWWDSGYSSLPPSLFTAGQLECQLPHPKRWRRRCRRWKIIWSNKCRSEKFLKYKYIIFWTLQKLS
jgi:hypothetical protein